MAKRINYVDVPVFMQMEVLECGAVCLAMVLAYYKKWLPIEVVRRDCGVSRDGSNAKNILKAAANYGLTAKAYKLEPNELKSNITFPCIIHWNFNHFVVLCGFKGNKAVINDPARGRITVSEKEFDDAFTGICLCFSPKETFERSGKRQSVLSFAHKRLKGSTAAVGFVIFTTFLISLLEITKLSMSKVFADFILNYNGYEYLLYFTVLLCVTGIAWTTALAVKETALIKINGKFAASGNTSFMWKILHMPVEFFSQRMTGDIQARMVSNSEITFYMMNIFAPIALDAVMLVLYLVIMLRYSLILTLVGVGAVLINILLCKYIAEKRINILRNMLRDKGKLMGTTVSGIEMIETIKASGAENGFFEKWSGYSAGINNAEIEYLKIDCKIGILPELVSTFAEIIVLTLGVVFITEGEFTIGMLLAFQSLLTEFSKPAKKLTDVGESMGQLQCSMERIEDVMSYPDDELYAYKENGDVEYDKLSGNIELSDVTFGYSPLSEPLIKNFNLKVSPGEKIAIVGASGCGKSTVAKLISGLYKPWSGKILFDGKTINEIDRAEFTGSVAVVDQDVVMFEDTVTNNIKLWDESIEDFEMIMASRDAKIHDTIIERNGGYNCMVYENGKNFSGGEKQRFEIARVLAQDPTIIVMDEATSALDSATEYEVVNSIAARGVTCIIIAHRLSTIRDCDEIIVMQNGEIAERGTHEQLYASGGIYTKLITSE